MFDGATEEQIEAELARAWIVDQSWKEAVDGLGNGSKNRSTIPTRFKMTMKFVVYILESWLGKRKYDVYSLNDPDYARHATAKEWLREVVMIQK